MYHCQNCLSEYNTEEYESNRVNTLRQSNVFQCTKCFSIGRVIHNLNSECPICCSGKTDCYFKKCGHSVCFDCESQFKEDKCCFCNQESVCVLVTYTESGTYYFDECKPIIKNCFKKLYYQFVDIADLHLRIYDRLYELCAEYYKFLQLLHYHDNNNAKIKLSPSKLIDQLWHTHLLDNENYNLVCQSICGYVLFHYPENSFKNNQSNYEERREKAIELYKEFFEVDPPAWIWSIKGKGSLIQLFIRTLHGTTLTINIPDNSEILTIKRVIEEKTGLPVCQQRLIFAGQQLSDDHDLNYYRIGRECTLHLVLALSGC